MPTTPKKKDKFVYTPEGFIDPAATPGYGNVLLHPYRTRKVDAFNQQRAAGLQAQDVAADNAREAARLISEFDPEIEAHLLRTYDPAKLAALYGSAEAVEARRAEVLPAESTGPLPTSTPGGVPTRLAPATRPPTVDQQQARQVNAANIEQSQAATVSSRAAADASRGQERRADAAQRFAATQSVAELMIDDAGQPLQRGMQDTAINAVIAGRPLPSGVKIPPSAFTALEAKVTEAAGMFGNANDPKARELGAKHIKRVAVAEVAAREAATRVSDAQVKYTEWLQTQPRGGEGGGGGGSNAGVTALNSLVKTRADMWTSGNEQLFPGRGSSKRPVQVRVGAARFDLNEAAFIDAYLNDPVPAGVDDGAHAIDFLKRYIAEQAGKAGAAITDEQLLEGVVLAPGVGGDKTQPESNANLPRFASRMVAARKFFEGSAAAGATLQELTGAGVAPPSGNDDPTRPQGPPAAPPPAPEGVDGATAGGAVDPNVWLRGELERAAKLEDALRLEQAAIERLAPPQR